MTAKYRLEERQKYLKIRDFQKQKNHGKIASNVKRQNNYNFCGVKCFIAIILHYQRKNFG